MIIDTHCHLDLAVFDVDIDAVLNRANTAGVDEFIIPAIDPEHWQRQFELAQEYPQIRFTLGFHPFFLKPLLAKFSVAQLISELDKTIQETLSSDLRTQFVGVGEIGVDRAVDIPLKHQESIFVQQLKLAKHHNLPVIMHHRKSHDRLLGLLKQAKFTQGGIIHAFSGNALVARQYIELGFKLGIGGTITYPRGSKTRKAILEVGLEHCVLETDSPDMPMCGRQGQRNEPAYITDVITVLAELFAVKESEVIEQTYHNVSSVFSLVPKHKII